MKRFLVITIFFTLLLVPCLAQAKQPKVIKFEVPKYPISVVYIGVQGEVSVIAQIDSQGKVSSVKSDGKNGLLKQICEEAVKNWKFSETNESEMREAEIFFDFRIKKNNNPKNNYKRPEIKYKFEKPNRMQITVIDYPRYNT
jgi:hypothetical protein